MSSNSSTSQYLRVSTDLAVEHHPDRARLVRHRLTAAIAIDDGETTMAERDMGVEVEALAIWSAMGECVGHRPDGVLQAGRQRVVERHDSADATHECA
jgi:hypothetical protein